MKLKKIMGCLVVMFLALTFLGITSVNAEVDPETLIYRLAPDGENLVIKGPKPPTPEEIEFYTVGVLTKALDEEGYTAYAYYDEGSTTTGTLYISEQTEDGSGFYKEYKVNISFEEAPENKVVESFIAKMKEFDPDKAETYYTVTDLGLINYYMTSVKSELWNISAPGRALKYSADIIELSDGGNIQFYLDTRAGMQDETLMYESAFGPMSVFYNGYSYGLKDQGLYLKRVIYIPEETGDTTEEYAKAAQDRINAYLGKNEVTVVYGGTISSLPPIAEDPLIDRNDTDGNYYNITVKGREYKFYIMKAPAEDLVVPTYLGKDIVTDITVTTDKSDVPLDTEVTAKPVEDDSIEKVLGTDNYKAYDIKLFSNGKNAAITKLENGKFVVSIPLPENLKNIKSENLTIYYINEKGEKEEHEEATIDKDKGIVSFETDHFSTYAIAEKSTENTNITPNPNTSDNIMLSVATLMLSMAGIVVCKFNL